MSVLNCAASVLVSWNVAENVALGFNALAPITDDAPASSLSYTPGTGGGQVDLHWEKTGIVIAPGVQNTYTLSALTDLLGRTVNFHTLTAVLVQVTNRVAGDKLALGNPEQGGLFPAPVADAFGGMYGGTSGGEYVYDLYVWVAMQTDGLAVSSGSSDTYPIKNVGTNAITFNLAFLGRSV